MLKNSAIICILAIVYAAPIYSKDECATVKECAEHMVKLANELKAENATLLEKIQKLEEALEAQKKLSADALEQRLVTLKNGVETNPFPGGNGVSGICPVGTYMVGARWKIDPGGPHGIMSWLGPVCRTMP